MRILLLRHVRPLFLLFSFLSAVSLSAQSLDDNWDHRFDLPGLQGTIHSSALDSDGNLYIRGDLDGANGLPGRQKILQWNDSVWRSLGTTNDTLIVEGKTLHLESNESVLTVGKILYTIADNFAPVQNQSAHEDYIVSWNGGEWSIVGGAFHGGVGAIAAFGSDIYAAGHFNGIGTDSIRNLARWDGSRWNDVGGGLDGSISSIAIDRNGAVYISGTISRVGNLDVTGNGARWDGSRWAEFGVSDDMVEMEMMVASGTTIYGHLRRIIYRLDGTEWRRISADIEPIYEIGAVFAVDQIGGLHVSAKRRDSVNAFHTLLRLNGNAWTELSYRFNAHPGTLTFGKNGSFAVTGYFQVIDDSVIANQVAIWDGSAWKALGSAGNSEGLIGDVSAAELSDGYLYVGGKGLRSMRTSGAHGVLRWSERSGWEEVGGGVNGTVSEIVRASNGDVYVGGCFSTAGNVTARNLARWDGAAWHPVGQGPDLCLSDFTVIHDTIYAAGGRVLQRWNGVRWEWIDGVTNGQIYAVVAADDGSVYVGGRFDSAGGMRADNIARWKNGSWHSLDGGMKMRCKPYVPLGPITAFVKTLDIDGRHLYAGGMFDSAGSIPAFNVARWNGEEWLSMDSGLVGQYSHALFGLQQDRAEVYSIRARGGEVHTGGRFYGAGSWSLFLGESSPRYMGVGGGIACWDERTDLWNAFGFSSSSAKIYDLALDDGNLYIVGDFSQSGTNTHSYRVARAALKSIFIEKPTTDQTLDLGPCPVGRFIDRDLVISNPATSTRTLAGKVVISGDPFAPAHEIEFHVAPGRSVGVPVRFSPAAVGFATGTARILHNSTVDSTPIVVALNGFGIPLNIAFEIKPDIIDFGEELQSSGTDSIQFVIRNHASSNSTLTIRAGEFLTAPFTLFSDYHYQAEDALKPVTIRPGDSTLYKVRLDRRSPGAFTQTIVFHHDVERGGAVAVPIHATVVPLFASLNVTPAQIDFGVIPINRTAEASVVVSADLRSNVSAFYNPLPMDRPYGLSLSSGYSLHAGESDTFNVTFAPTAEAMFYDKLRISDAFRRDTLRVPVRGRGVVPSPRLQVSATAVDFGSIAAYEVSERDVVITNRPEATGDLTFTIQDPSFPFLSAERSRTLKAGEADSLRIRFAPNRSGTFTDTIFIAHNASEWPNPLQIALRGESFTTSVDADNIRTAGEAIMLTAEPNPASGSTRIRFRLPNAGTACITIHALDGRETARLIDRRLEAGEHTIEWDAGGVEAGVYLCRLKQGEVQATQRIVVGR